MATNLGIDEKLLNKAKRLGKHRTKKEAVNTALREYLRRFEKRSILDLAGTIDFDPDYDYKAARNRR